MATEKKPRISNSPSEKKESCGVIMPISAIGTYSKDHWSDVLAIIKESLEESPFAVDLVSSSDEVRVIQEAIVKNVYTNSMIVCDVSAGNPNVLFELGLRLAFDKPFVVIKDDKTPFNFDTGPVQHLIYPSDLRYPYVVSFQEDLLQKVMKTYEAYKDPNYKTYLKTFGEFIIPKLETKEVSGEQYIIEEIKAINRKLDSFHSQPVTSDFGNRASYDIEMSGLVRLEGPDKKLKVLFEGADSLTKEKIMKITSTFGIKRHSISNLGVYTVVDLTLPKEINLDSLVVTIKSLGGTIMSASSKR